MSTLKDEVKGILKEADTNIINEFFRSEINENERWDSDEATEFKLTLTNAGISFNHEDNYGGEDCGSEYWSVYSFKKESEMVYVKFEGWYASYDGSNFDKWYFAKAVPKSGFDFVKA